MAVTVLTAGAVVATPSAGSASGTADHLPWRTIVAVAGSTNTVYSYTTDSDDPADIGGAGFVGMAGARDVVATPDDDAVFVLGGPEDGDPALVRRWTVVADGELGSAGPPIEVGVGATKLALGPAGRHLYTVNPASDSITMVDTTNSSVEHTFSIAETPTDLVITQDGLYGVVLDDTGGLTLLDLVTGMVVERQALGSDDIAGIALARGQTLHDGAQRSVVLMADRGAGLVRSVAVEPDVTPALLSVRTTSLADVVPESIAVSAREGRVWFADSAHDWLVGLDYDSTTATVDSIGHTVELDSDFGQDFALDPNGEFADVHGDGATTVKRFALKSGNLVGTVGTYASSEIHLRTTPVQAATVTFEQSQDWSVMRGVPATITAVPSDAGHVHHYVWDFHDGSAPVTTTDPVVDHTWAVEGRYEVSVVAVTDPGFAAFDGGLSTQSVYGGQQFARHGRAGARASQMMRVAFPVGPGAPGTYSGTWNLANTPSGYATFTVPDSTGSIEVTLAGAAGGRGESTAGDAICNHLGDDLDCSNDGYPEGGTVTAKVTVPVGPPNSYTAATSWPS